MHVFFFDPSTRLFAGCTEADPSPREPGRFLIPAFATTSPLPQSVALTPVAGSREMTATMPEGKQLWFNSGDAWELIDLPQAPSETGSPSNPQPVEPTFEERLKALQDGVQLHLDAIARAYGYDSIASGVSYAEEPAVRKFQLEGQALRAWRSLVWAYCYQTLDAVQVGLSNEPTLATLIEALPVFVPPPPVPLPAPTPEPEPEPEPGAEQ